MQNTVAALKNKENQERWKNVVDLEKFGQPAAEFLVQALADEDRWVRYLAADALANIGATNSVDSLISLLRDPEQDVRFAAAAALGKIGDPKAIKSLQEVLRRDNGYVKVAAEEALIMISPQGTGPVYKGSPSH
jgi:HEAT repeat protein